MDEAIDTFSRLGTTVNSNKQASKQASKQIIQKWRSPFRLLWCPSLARAIGRADLGATGTTG
jgi:hypothetical protein